MPTNPPQPIPQPKSYQGESGGKNTAYTMQRRLAATKTHEFTIESNFTKMGYRNREDISILPPGTLVVGSYNVLTNVYGRIGVVKGYTIDGQSNSTLSGITSSFDFTKLNNDDTHVRTWGSNFDFRYVTPTGTVLWTTIFTGLIVGNDVNYIPYWDLTQLTNCTLFVNGSSNIYRWSGAVAPFLSATTNTITKQGTDSWAQAGFDTNGIGNVTYTPVSTTAVFQVGETITGGTSGTTATVTQNSNNILVLDSISGAGFIYPETITGSTSGATGTVNVYTPPSIPSVIIDGVTYQYTGGELTTTLTGVTPDPTLVTHTPGTAVAQAITVTPNSDLTVVPPEYVIDLIGNLDNQVFLGSKASSVIYTSAVSNYTDYSNDLPRLQGQGATTTIADHPTAFINQEDSLYVSAGKNIWYESVLTETTTTTTIGSTAVSIVYETLTFAQLKVANLQSAQSQACVTKIQNDIVYLSYEPIINSLGRVTDILISPQITDLSYSIVNDMNKYDLTGVSMIYFRQFLYVSIPAEGIIRIYNMTQPKTHYWEAPVTYPVARFSIIDGALYGHAYGVPETYKLFDGYQFDGHPIPAAAYFNFEQYGTRPYPKNFNLFYLEGYITSNCTLNYGFNYDMNGCGTTRTYSLDGTSSLVCIGGSGDASLGKAPLGSRPLSGLDISPMTVYSTNTGLPPKFRAIKQLSKLPFYELQVFFTSLGSDQQWELVAYGPSVGPATEGNNSRQY